MLQEFKIVSSCLACGNSASSIFVSRNDGVNFLRCSRCHSLYLEKIPQSVESLYTDNYFALTNEDAGTNQINKIGYEDSYQSIYTDLEFYWAFRLSDFSNKLICTTSSRKKCLDIGAATGRLLNVFKALDYDTYGIEFSTPARNVALDEGHIVFSEAVEAISIPDGGFNVITTLEVIEHVEHLPEFFSGIYAALANNGVFLGYFPSTNDAAFSSSKEYHWLHNSFEHLIYPSEEGIRLAMNHCFGENLYFATFMTQQGQDVIPNTLVLGFKGVLSADNKKIIVDLFSNLNALNEGGILEKKLTINPHPRPITDSDFIVALMASKFGMGTPSEFILDQGYGAIHMSIEQRLDLLTSLMHQGQIDILNNLLDSNEVLTLPISLINQLHQTVFNYESNTFTDKTDKSNIAILQARELLIKITSSLQDPTLLKQSVTLLAECKDLQRQSKIFLTEFQLKESEHRKAMEDILNSSSWLMTKPLRRLSQMLHKFI
jgi:SAM-dependent methyltransferase